MFDIEWIEIENFRSYAGQHKFDFPNEPGLYFLSGDNQFQRTLESNGAGKSTFLDAIFWCLFGRTSRGLKGPEVKTWGMTARCAVTLGLTVQKKAVVITRTQGPNALLLSLDGSDPENVEQEVIQDLIRMTADMFLYAFMTPQVGDMFFDLKPALKLSLFSQIMGLDYWLTKADDAKRRCKSLETTINQTNATLANIEGKIESLIETIGLMKDKEQQFEDDCEKKIKELDRSLTITKKSSREQKDKLEDLEHKRDNYLKDINDLKSQKTEIDEAMQDLIKARSDLESSIKVLVAECEREDSVLKRLRSAKGTCPTCLQEVTVDHIEDEAAKINKRLKRAHGNIDNIKIEIRDIEKDIQHNKADMDKILRDLKKYEDRYRQAQQDYSDLKAKIQNTDQEIDRIIDLIKDEETKPNPFKASIKESDEAIDRFENTMKQHKKELASMNETLEEASFWTNGFKRLRLFIIEETLKQLELEINNNLVQVGLIDWSIGFSVEKETKSGGISTGFSVMITPPNNDEPVRWEAWSMGETQRLRMAGAMGISNLILDRIGMQSGFEFYDEISQHTTPRGVRDMLDALQQRAIETNKKVWLVDHQVYDYGGFKGQLHVVRDNKGSMLEYTELSEGE